MLLPRTIKPIDGPRVSHASEIGRAAEHIAVADIILQGVTAYIPNAVLPYDIVADLGNDRVRIQVKSAPQPRRHGTSSLVYRFHLALSNRTAVRNTILAVDSDVDIFALVAMDIRRVAYLHASEVTSRKCDLRAPGQQHGRQYPNGSIRQLSWGRSFENLSCFVRAYSGVIVSMGASA